MQFFDFKTPYKKIALPLSKTMQSILENHHYIMGSQVASVEKELAEFVGSKYCITTSSGTDALLMAFLALDIKAGDEIITTPFSFISVIEMAALLGARSVFVDIDPKTYLLNPFNLEKAITPKTKAIVPVGLYGQPADFDAIHAIASPHGIAVIDDAAQSLGSTYKGRSSGTLGAISCTSFYPTKPLGGYGDGGACFTDDDQLALALKQIRNHGETERYHHARVGICGRLDSLQAAVLSAKLNLFKEEIALRQEVASRYTQALAAWVKTPFVESYNTSVYAQYTIEIKHREACAAALKAQGIPTAVHYPSPLYKQPAYAHLTEDTFPYAELASQHVISLPMHPYLTQSDQDRVIQALKDFLG